MQKYEKRTKLGKTKTVFDTDSTSKTKEETDDNRWSIDTAQCLQLLETLRTAQDIAFVEWPQRGEDTRCTANGHPRQTTVENFIRLADALLQEADIFAQISADDVIRFLREGVDAIS